MSEPHRIIVDTLPELEFVLRARKAELEAQYRNAHRMSAANASELNGRLLEIRSILAHLNG